MCGTSGRDVRRLLRLARTIRFGGAVAAAAGEDQHLIDKLAHAIDLAGDDFVLTLDGRAAPALEDFGRGEHRGQRIPQLVPELTDLLQIPVGMIHATERNPAGYRINRTREVIRKTVVMPRD